MSLFYFIAVFKLNRKRSEKNVSLIAEALNIRRAIHNGININC